METDGALSRDNASVLWHGSSSTLCDSLLFSGLHVATDKLLQGRTGTDGTGKGAQT